MPRPPSGLSVDRAQARATQTIHQSELNRLVEQLHALRLALQPFADFADALPVVVPGQPRMTDEGPAFACKSPKDPTGEERVITFGHLRHAKALLDKLLTDDEQRFIARTERKMAGISDLCIALGCGKPIPGAEPVHLRGFCSDQCEKTALNLADIEDIQRKL